MLSPHKPLNTWQVTLRIRISRITFLYLEHTIATFKPKQSQKIGLPNTSGTGTPGQRSLISGLGAPVLFSGHPGIEVFVVRPEGMSLC